MLNYAQIFGLSDQNIISTTDFLRSIISDEQINNWPAYIGCSLKRMKECYEYLTTTLGYDKEELDLNAVIWSISKQNIIDNIKLINNCPYELPDKYDYSTNPNILLKKPVRLIKELDQYK